MLINIHTHRRTNRENQLEIVIGEDTVGIHPWNLLKFDFRRAQSTILMIGETGLDRSDKYKNHINLQKKFLEIHLNAATYFHLPIVLHCVRAHSDLLQILKEKNYQGKILLHDFSGNLNQINDYLKFDVYFSFKRKWELISSAPIQRVFLETDDEEVNLEELYQKVKIKEEQFEKNYLTFFSDTQEVRSADVIDYLSAALIAN